VAHEVDIPESPADRARRLAGEPWFQIGGGNARPHLARTFTEVLAYRELLGLLVRRELKAKYKDSSLGLLWTLIRPLVTLLVYFVAIGHFLGAARSIPDFAIYVFTGLITWQLFTEIVTLGSASILTNAGLVKKVYLPREVFPLSVVGSSLVNFAMQFVVLLAACLLLGKFPTGDRLLYFPLAILCIVVWAYALSLVLSSATVYFRDTTYLVEVALTILFWICPIVYSWTFVANVISGPALEAYLWSPTTVSVLAMQHAFWIAGDTMAWPDGLTTRLLVLIVVGLGALLAGQWVFTRAQANFAQEL
jgi:ABC-2 type transport system permease protein